MLSRTCSAFVVFASFTGPTGDIYTETAGSSAIWSPHGTAARTGPEVGGIARHPHATPPHRHLGTFENRSDRTPAEHAAQSLGGGKWIT